METLGIIANCTKPNARDVLDRLREKAAALGLHLLADPDTAAYLNAAEVEAPADMLDRIDVLMALGGDGTMLRAVRALNGRDVPVIGVNIGSLGFLTSVGQHELERALQCLAQGDYRVSDTAVAQAVVACNGEETARYRALNDVVIARGAAMRVVVLTVSVGGDVVTSYKCDGLIVSTPAGSTGHSLSAGGPILSPETSAFVISVICPHTLSSRPLIVPDHSEIRITVSQTAVDLLLSVDGQIGHKLTMGDTVSVVRSDRGAHFVRLPGHSYFGVLRQKLKWSGSSI